MAKAIRISDGKEFEYVIFNGENLEEARLLFKATNNASVEVQVDRTERGSLEMRVFTEGLYKRSIFAAVDSYILNSGGKPEIFEAGPFFRYFQRISTPTSIKASVSQSKDLWENPNNILNIREALSWYLETDNIGTSYKVKESTNSGVTMSKCNGNCKCKKKEVDATTAEVYEITSNFDAEEFQAFIGDSIPFHVTYRYTSIGTLFMGLTLQTGNLFAVNITPGDSVIRLSNGRLAHTPGTHSNL